MQPLPTGIHVYPRGDPVTVGCIHKFNQPFTRLTQYRLCVYALLLCVEHKLKDLIDNDTSHTSVALHPRAFQITRLPLASLHVRLRVKLLTVVRFQELFEPWAPLVCTSFIFFVQIQIATLP